MVRLALGAPLCSLLIVIVRFLSSSLRIKLIINVIKPNSEEGEVSTFTSFHAHINLYIILEGKTDYQQRKSLSIMDNNKYGNKKYRFVVRITNRRIICSINYATLMGDKVLCSADSQELRRFGLTAGLTNYPSAYCTGLLLARRLLQSLGLDTMYKGQTEVNGRKYDVSKFQGEKRPFKCFLDVGL